MAFQYRRPDHRQPNYLQRRRPAILRDRIWHQCLRVRAAGLGESPKGNAMTRAFLVALLVLCALPAAAQRRPGPEGPPNPFNGNAQAATEGEQIYNKNCTVCHGVNGTAG